MALRASNLGVMKAHFRLPVTSLTGWLAQVSGGAVASNTRFYLLYRTRARTQQAELGVCVLRCVLRQRVNTKATNQKKKNMDRCPQHVTGR